MNSRETIKELRKKIKKMLKKVPDGERISVKNVKNLEKLIFQEYVIDEQKGIKIKIPVWTGDFLSKLDLSELDFSDVAWGLYCVEDNRNPDKVLAEKYVYHDDVMDRLKEIVSNYNIASAYEDYNELSREIYDCFDSVTVRRFINTNAKIDLKKSFEYKTFNHIFINCADFEGTDLSNNSLYNEKVTLYDSYLKDTNLNLKDARDISVYGTDLENINLSNFSVRFYNENDFGLGDNIQYSCNEEDYPAIYFNIEIHGDFIPCFKNTGLNIQYNGNMEEYFQSKYELPLYINGIEIKSLTDYLYKSGLFDGCKVDGSLLKSEYMTSEELLESIEEQVSRIRKKEDK